MTNVYEELFAFNNLRLSPLDSLTQGQFTALRLCGLARLVDGRIDVRKPADAGYSIEFGEALRNAAELGLV